MHSSQIRTSVHGRTYESQITHFPSPEWEKRQEGPLTQTLVPGAINVFETFTILPRPQLARQIHYLVACTPATWLHVHLHFSQSLPIAVRGEKTGSTLHKHFQFMICFLTDSWLLSAHNQIWVMLRHFDTKSLRMS